MEPIIRKCNKILRSHYGKQFMQLVIYGSLARDDATPESDIDLLVLLKSPFDYFLELRVIVDMLYSIQLESDRLISAKPVDILEYEQGCIQFYRNVKQEGIFV